MVGVVARNSEVWRTHLGDVITPVPRSCLGQAPDGEDDTRRGICRALRPKRPAYFLGEYVNRRLRPLQGLDASATLAFSTNFLIAG